MMPQQLTYADLDWQILWHNAQRQKGWKGKDASAWDAKSASFASRNTASPFVSLVLSHLPLAGNMSVLDVGSGPGTLALPLAAQVESVCALDFSGKMLDILNDTAKLRNIDNITTIQCSWEDDWQALGIGTYDLAIASRSLSVADLGQAIEKLNRHAQRSVCIVDRISPTPFDPDAFTALGRPFQSGPDYIFTLNVLYTMGIHPHMTILELDAEIHFDTIEQALQSYTWMIKDMTAQEERLLEAYCIAKACPSPHGGICLRRKTPPKWALLWWQKDSLASHQR